jgi:hypothetical protein
MSCVFDGSGPQSSEGSLVMLLVAVGVDGEWGVDLLPRVPARNAAALTDERQNLCR